jgi:hypothetical protein
MQNTPHDPHTAQGNGHPGTRDIHSSYADTYKSTQVSPWADQQALQERYAHIPGWGIDADPSNDPTRPMRSRHADDPRGYTWERPAQQTMDMEINCSVERPHVTSVFGTAVPPQGLSGMIRRMAFKRSENVNTHWLPLLLADRVNMVEGIIEDLGRGRLPNYFREKGLSADWKYRRPQLIAKMAITSIVVLGSLACLSRHGKSPRQSRNLQD